MARLIPLSRTRISFRSRSPTYTLHRANLARSFVCVIGNLISY